MIALAIIKLVLFINIFNSLDVVFGEKKSMTNRPTKIISGFESSGKKAYIKL